jgi:hypothetical protein
MQRKNTNQVLIMSIGAVVGGLIGWLIGLWWLSPGILIPIGVVVGLAIGLSVANSRK